jgi:hypothetical protein
MLSAAAIVVDGSTPVTWTSVSAETATAAASSTTTSHESTSATAPTAASEAHVSVIILVEDLADHGSSPFDAVRRSGDPQRLLGVELGRLLDDHDLGSGRFLKVPDGLSSLSDDQTDLVTGDHHFEEARSSSTAVVRLVLARRATVGSVALIGNDVLDGSLGISDSSRLTGESALPLRMSSIVLGHLDLAPGLALKSHNLLSAAADDEADHFARDGDGFGGHALGHVANASLHHSWS